MSGMLETKTAAFGTFPFSVARAASSWLLKVGTGVMVLSEEVHASFAPMSTVTYSTPRLPAVVTWAFSSPTFAPERASLQFLPVIAGFFALILT